MLISSSPLVLRRNLIHVETDSLVNFNKTLAFFYTHRPNKYLPLTNEDVIKANQSILLHKSQFQEHDLSWKMLNKYLSYRRKRFGNLLHPKCDGFFVLGPIHQHSFPEINHY
jgi:hypothetical protein